MALPLLIVICRGLEIRLCWYTILDNQLIIIKTHCPSQLAVSHLYQELFHWGDNVSLPSKERVMMRHNFSH